MKRRVTIYGLKTGNHIHYVGSTVDLAKRIGGHRAQGKPPIRRIVKAGCEVVKLAECEAKEAHTLEARYILEFKNIGQCELNETVPRKPIKRFYFGGASSAVRHIKTGAVYPSLIEASCSWRMSARSISQSIVNNEGRFEYVVWSRKPKTAARKLALELSEAGK